MTFAPSDDRTRYLHAPVVFLGGLILMMLALYNGYPIVTADSGTYINSGFELSPPEDRPIFYGLFLRAASLGISLWLAIYAQCLLLSFVLLRFVTAWLPRMPEAHKICFLIFISLCTIGGWYAGQVMPDIFVAIMILSALLFLKQGSSRSSRAVMIGICFLALITHNSNYITLTIFSLLLLAATFRSSALRPLRLKAIVLLALSLIAWLALCTSNFVAKRGFVTSTVTHVFLMGKLVESGVLKTYLDKACPVYNYRICAYKDSLPPAAWGFVWDERSPMHRTGGWEANREEYSRIVSDIAGRPKYWPYLAFKSGEATLRQLAGVNIDGVFELEWIKYMNGSPPYENVRRYFPHELNELAGSKENNNGLNTPFMNHVFAICLVISSLAALLVRHRDGDAELAIIAMLLLALIFLNAFTTATFANVLTRLNSRVIWLIPLLNAVYIYRYFAARLMRRTMSAT